MLALYDPLDVADEGARNQAIASSELPFNLIFTVEMLIKLIAYGVWGRGSYFGGDKWNWCVSRVSNAALTAFLERA